MKHSEAARHHDNSTFKLLVRVTLVLLHFMTLRHRESLDLLVIHLHRDTLCAAIFNLRFIN